MTGMHVAHPLAEAALRTRLGSITGVHVASFEARLRSDGLDVRLKVHGWSPTLNAIDSAWQADVVCSDDSDDQAQAMIQAFADRISIQEERARQGILLGTAAPFGIADNDGPASDTKVGHILVDRALATMLAGDEGRLLSEVRDSIWLLHVDDAGGQDDGLVTEYSGIVEDDDGHETGEQAVVGRMLVRDVEVRDGVVFDGRDLKLATKLPATILTAVPGRRLGEVVELPDTLSGLRICDAFETDEGMVLRIEPDLDTLDELDRGGPTDG